MYAHIKGYYLSNRKSIINLLPCTPNNLGEIGEKMTNIDLEKMLALCGTMVLLLSAAVMSLAVAEYTEAGLQTMYLGDTSAPVINEYSEREPIIIDGNDDLEDQASDEGWPGDGSEGDPYIIEGYEIDADGENKCIHIENTNLHLVIRDNLLYGTAGVLPTGVLLISSLNVEVTGNDIESMFGIRLTDESNSNNVSHNEITGTYGIEVDYCMGVHMWYNEISVTQQGIMTDESPGTRISHNEISSRDDSLGVGISMEGQREHNTIEGNTINDIIDTGIYIGGGGMDEIIDSNMIDVDEGTGISVETSGNDIIGNDIWSSDNGIIVQVGGNHIEDNSFYFTTDGILINGANNNVIIDNYFGNVGTGIAITDGGTGNTLTNNSFSHVSYGIEFDNCNENTARENHLERIFRVGIGLNRSSENDILDNTVLSDGDHGIRLWGEGSDSNTIEGNEISGELDSGIHIDEGDENQILENDIILNDHEGYGIYIAFTHLNKISYNTIQGAYYGIYLDEASTEEINDNTIFDCGRGIQIEGYSHHTIIYNTIYDTPFHGIRVDNSDFNNIIHNTLYGNTNVAINLVEGSTDNNIGYNHIFDNNRGITFGTSSGNTVQNNIIEGNTGQGIRQWDSDNLIFHNDFIDNEVHAYDNSENHWDDGDPDNDGSGGNFWDDYEGEDRGDGIGEDPYTDIAGDAGAQDRYPWVEAHNAEAEFILHDVSIVPDTVELDEMVTIEGIVENVGYQSHAVVIILYVGDMEDNVDVVIIDEIGPGDTEWVTFEGEPLSDWNITEVGTYAVKLEPEQSPENAWEGELEVVGPAEFVLNDWSITPDPAAMDESVTVQGEVENMGGMEGTTPINLFINDMSFAVYGQDVELLPGDTEWVTFEGVPIDDWGIEDPGVYDVKVEPEEWPENAWESELEITEVMYELTVNSNEGGSVIDPGEGTFDYEKDTVVDLVAEADEGYVFVEWTGDIDTVEDPTSPTTTITINDDDSITAEFEEVLEEYQLTIDSTAGGSVTDPGEDTFDYEEGEDVNLVAEADEGYGFVEWTGEDISTIADPNSPTTTITMNDDYSITAEFEEVLEEYQLTIDSTAGGSVTDPGEDTFDYEEDTVVDLVAEADEGYGFVEWTSDIGTIEDPTSPTTTITIEGNYSITAVFEADDPDDPEDTDDPDDEETEIMDILSDYWWLLIALIIVVVLILVLVMARGKNGQSTDEPYTEQPDEQRYEEEPPPPQEPYQEAGEYQDSTEGDMGPDTQSENEI